MNKIKAYFKSEASKSAYQITFWVSLTLTIVGILVLAFFKTIIFKSYTEEVTSLLSIIILVIPVFSTLMSYSVYKEKKREEYVNKTIKSILGPEWKNVIFDYSSTNLPEIIQPLCYDFVLEAKFEDSLIYIRTEAFNGRYYRQMQTKDYEWFVQHFEVEI